MKHTDNMDEAQKKEGRMRRHFSIRINMFFFATFVLFSVLIVRLAYLQFIEGPALNAKQIKQTRKDVTIPPIRGNIYDSGSKPIAWTTSTQSLFYQITPGQDVEQQIEIAHKLEEIFKNYGDKTADPLTVEEIFDLMDTGYNLDGTKRKSGAKLYNYQPRRIKSGLNRKEIAYIAEHQDELPGVETSEESTRVYDQDSVAVQLIGYLRPFKGVVTTKSTLYNNYREKQDDYLQDEFVGTDGLELMYEDVLRGKNGSKNYPVNSLNQIVGQVEITPPEKGKNLFLTINKDVQLATEKAITDHISFLQHANDSFFSRGKGAISGYAVAMEVDTGKVISMASMPDYDPMVYANAKIAEDVWTKIKYLQSNGTIRDQLPNILDDKERAKHPSSVVPLGSTIKPLSVLLGLNEGLFTPWEQYYDTGVYLYGKDNNAKIPNSDGVGNGSINAAKAIEKSSNTFMAAMVGARLYNKYNGGEKAISVWDTYMKEFGLGVSTESGLPGEYAGTLEYTNRKVSSVQNSLIQGSFGQQARYTVLQLAQYASMLANHGKRYKPQFVNEIKTYDGQVIQSFQPQLLNEEKFSNTYWNVLRDGMKSGVEGFEDFPYALARKTGTSQQEIGGRGKIDNAVFIGYAPADNPKLAVAVVVPDGGFGRYGAAPIARHIFDAYDQYIGLDAAGPKGPPANPPKPLLP
ncbi:penicillin-binding transpeptidase domain-containing protein [Paenibacillus aurantius]|uniref:Penicillin-binding transpeptidase domain-containing protein n=1 Tax=Paenibacillus aurantius TaxID=2918900 RepID=A0AA96LIJ3_9BACL|nr:penicillin-binding transpeptidase domain-containing protein [Paenibacillus aurantius]WNQ12616.1 penicillin-binding transpeptidase domain-containing protein [Paenibacillus aurantius]